MNYAQALFEFEEDVALKDGLYCIAENVLHHAVKATGAKGGMFLYSPPGQETFDWLATEGYSKSQLQVWKKWERKQNLPLPQAIDAGQSIFLDSSSPVLNSLDATAIAALSMGEVNFCFFGFAVSFQDRKEIDEDTRKFLLRVAAVARDAFEKMGGEGV